jgi:hypothetical protein
MSVYDFVSHLQSLWSDIHKKERAMDTRTLRGTLALLIGIFLGVVTSKLISTATAEEKTHELKLFQPLGKEIILSSMCIVIVTGVT